MGFDWKEYLDLARFLAGQSDSYSQEAAHRSGVSRAYFAAYCHARDYATGQLGFTPSGGVEDHADLRQHYDSRRQTAIALDLDELRRWRNQCDYDNIVGPFLPLMLLQAIRMADEILSQLR